MKRVLIVHAHPETQSFCASLKNEAQFFFTANGFEVKTTDLYALGFNPVGNKHDFKELKNDSFFKYQQEQVNAFENNLFVSEVKNEIEKFEWCDVLIFNFPLWWFGLPAILKGWVDRVFAMGVAYGNGKGVYENGFYKQKTAFLTITTGGPDIAYNGGKNGDLETILFPIHHGMFYFTGMTVLPPFISFSPARKTKEELEAEIKRYKDYLANIKNVNPIYTNR